MTDRELQKLNRRELVELFRAQAKSCEAAKKRLEELEQENQTLKESLTQIGKTMKEQREREVAFHAALAEKTAVLAEKDAVLAEKDAALQRLERELAEAESEQADKGRLEEQVDLLFERFRQIKPILQEKDRRLQASEERIAEQERMIRSLRERLGGRG